jgi:hypothetical protein
MSKITKRVFRNDRGGVLGCTIGTVVLTGIAAGIAYAADAGTGGWACVGGGALLLVLGVCAVIANVMDQSPKLIVDAEGIHDLRKSPPVEYDWEDYKKVFVDMAEGEGSCPEVTLELVDRSGDSERVTLSVSGLDAKPQEIAEAIEEVWQEVKSRRGETDPVDEPEKEEEKPKKPKSKPWKKGHDEDEDDGGEDDKPPEKPRKWEW